MNHKKTLIALAVIALAAIPISIIMNDGSDASVSIEDDSVWGKGFTNTGDGTLFVVLKNTESEDQIITIIVTEGSKELTRTNVTVPADSTYTAEVRFRLGSVGSHNVTVTCEPYYLFPQLPNGTHVNSNTAVITVTESILSKPSTYAAIAVVAILIVIAAFLYMRNAPTTKPDTTFTELDRQKKESRADAEEVPKASATERKRYKDSSGRPKEAAKPPAPPPEEKKAASFTELDRQKKEKKEAPPPKQKESPPPKKKESSSEEPKKIKYVSSRRK